MKNNTSRFRFILVILISILFGYYLGVNKVNLDWKNYNSTISIINKEPPAGTPTVDFSLFWTVWNKLQTEYYDKSKLDPVKMENGAIAGIVQTLGDPYTMFLPKEQNASFKEGLSGQFSGIGAELGTSPDNKQVIVISPLVGSPAEKAGLKAGDIITKVDGTLISDWTLSQTVTNIRGQKGTEVTLTVLHKDSKDSVDIKIVRDTITVKSVEGWVRKAKDIDSINSNQDAFKGKEQESVAYVRLSEFGDATNQDWSSLVGKLKTDIQKNNAKGIILDLRNNPGGYLTDAVFIAGEFLNQGTPVVIEDDGTNRQTLSVQRQGIFTDKSEYPLIVLINKGSASASEIVSGALSENNRATLLGDTSFGKGTIQQAEDLGDGAGLHVTIAKWLTPNGNWVHGKGITPDIQVSLDPKEPARDLQLEKAVLDLLK